MNGMVQFFKNLIYLSKFSLKSTVMRFPYFDLNLEYLFDDMLWLLPPEVVSKPKIYSADETVNFLLNTKMSLARFGDGEISLIQGRDIPYQKYSRKLGSRLKEILSDQQENLMVGIDYTYFNISRKDFDKMNNMSKRFALYSVPSVRRELMKYIKFDRIYCNTSLCCLEKNDHSEEYYNKIREIWANQEIVVVGCKNLISILEYNIYDNAKKIDYVYTPNVNSFEKYDEIFSSICNFSKEKLIILMTGPASKVLASDLTALGYRALDFGHLAKAYDYYKREVPITDENLSKFCGID